jgi:hypothetical protein
MEASATIATTETLFMKCMVLKGGENGISLSEVKNQMMMLGM